MFGLQAPDYENDQAYDRHRLHYCASCKTIGQKYGQSSRLLLNYDLVFLGELLTALSQEKLEDWEPNLRAVNHCFSLPQQPGQSFILEYVAALHLFLAELKIQDQIEDGGQRYWRWAKSFYRPNFQKAMEALEAWGLDRQKCSQLAASQLEYEASEPSDFKDLSTYLTHIAAPTAKITAEVLSVAADCLNLNAEALKDLAYSFGQLTYLIDAYDDWDKDLRKGDFNPFIRWGTTKQIAWQFIIQQKELVENALAILPLKEELQVSFSVRLTSNLFKKHKEEVPQTKWELAKAKAAEIVCQPNNFQSQLKYNLLAWAFFIQPERSFKPWIFFTTLAALFTGFALQNLPIQPQKGKSRKNPCRRRKEECRKAVIGILIILGLIVLLILGFMIWGILLLVNGSIFWGLFLLLLFPFIAGIFFLIRAINRAKMTKRERRRADRKTRRKKRLFKFLYKKSTK
jgi:cbb3-type cytochrome oxidase subunit 3